MNFPGDGGPVSRPVQLHRGMQQPVRLIMVDEHQPKPGRVKQVSLPADAKIAATVIDYQVIIALAA